MQSVVAAAIGGENIGETVEGLQRFPINVRYPRDYRDSIGNLRDLPIVTERGAQIRLSDVATIRISDGPPMIKSENARPSGWVYVDIRGRDLSGSVRAMQRAVAAEVKLPPGYSIAWSGQFEYMERAAERLQIVVPAMLAIILVMLYLTFRRIDEALLVMAILPFSVIGGVWLLYALDHNVSIASAVGFIGLAGVTAEFGIVMLVYLKQAWDERVAKGERSETALLEAIREGAALRVRPKAMTVATTVLGLMPILWETGTGSEITQRIAAPMIGGMITAPLLVHVRDPRGLPADAAGRAAPPRQGRTDRGRAGDRRRVACAGCPRSGTCARTRRPQGVDRYFLRRGAGGAGLSWKVSARSNAARTNASTAVNSSSSRRRAASLAR